MPGPNDQYISPDGSVQPGLGADEPSEEQRAGMRSAGLARLTALKAELEVAGAVLTEKERAILLREQEIEKRELALEARERAAAAAAKKAG